MQVSSFNRNRKYVGLTWASEAIRLAVVCKQFKNNW